MVLNFSLNAPLMSTKVAHFVKPELLFVKLECCELHSVILSPAVLCALSGSVTLAPLGVADSRPCQNIHWAVTEAGSFLLERLSPVCILSSVFPRTIALSQQPLFMNLFPPPPLTTCLFLLYLFL